MKQINMRVIIAAAVVGVAAVLLTFLGNPANMGFCIACFERDTAGSLGLHSAAVVQNLRPEIIGIVLGAFIMAVAKKEFKARGGSSPATRFILGGFVMMGALMFLGCPLRLVLRLGGGDANAIVGLAGFVVGIGIGSFVLSKGFALKRSHSLSKFEGKTMPIVAIGLLCLVLIAPELLKYSKSGPGSLSAPVFASLGIAMVVGALAQRARFCMVGGIRDGIMFKEFTQLYGFITIFVVVLIANLATGNFKFSFELQPIAHSDHLWNFIGMVIVGWGSVLLGGCPLRQLVMASEGNSDSTVTVFGMIMGAALCHNFGLAASPDSLNEAGELVVGGVSTNGQIMAVIALVIFAVISFANMNRATKK